MFEIAVAIGVLTFAGWLLAQRADDPYYTVAMTLFGFLLGIAVAVTLADSAVTGDFSSPYLAGSDGEGYFIQAHILAQAGIMDYQQLIRSNYLGYQILLAVLFTIFSPTLLVGLLTNCLMILGSIACVQRATALLTQSDRAARLAAIAFMMTTAHVFYALVLLKDPALLLAFALILLAVAKIHQDARFGARPVIYALLALAIIITMRSTLLVFLAMLLLIIGRKLLQRRASMVVALVALAVIAAPFAASFSIYSLDSGTILGSVTENTVVSDRLSEGDIDVGGVAGQAGSFFLGLPFILRLPLFFIPTIVQMLLPFDMWSTQFLTDYGPFFLYRNLNILWLGFVLPWTIYALFSLRRVESPLVSRLYIAGAAYFAFIAIIYGGLIPRYASTALVFIYPAIGYWWARRATDPAVRQATGHFFLLYYVVAVMAIVAYFALRFLRG